MKPTLTESEKLAILTVLDVKELPNWTLTCDGFADVLAHLRDGKNGIPVGNWSADRILSLRDEIDELVGAEKKKTEETADTLNITAGELDDLRGAIKTFIYKLQDKFPIVNGALKGDLAFEDLKREIGVY